MRFKVMSTLNKWNSSNGSLNPALKSKDYDAIAMRLAQDSTLSTESALELFTEIIVNMGVRATSESFAEYFNAKRTIRIPLSNRIDGNSGIPSFSEIAAKESADKIADLEAKLQTMTERIAAETIADNAKADAIAAKTKKRG